MSFYFQDFSPHRPVEPQRQEKFMWLLVECPDGIYRPQRLLSPPEQIRDILELSQHTWK